MPYTHQQNGTAECSMCTILDAICSAMAKSRMPLKYWADAVSTVVYTQNLIPLSRQPSTIPAELWSRRWQDIFYLWPFGTTAYAYIPGDLNLSKLFPWSVKVTLLGYFGHDSYKLLEKNTSTIFRSHNVIFEEGITYYARQPTPISFTDKNDPFPYRQSNQIQMIEKNKNHRIKRELEQEPVGPSLQVIAPWPSTISNLHKDKHKKNTDLTTQTTNILLTELPVNEYGS